VNFSAGGEVSSGFARFCEGGAALACEVAPNHHHARAPTQVQPARRVVYADRRKLVVDVIEGNHDYEAAEDKLGDRVGSSALSAAPIGQDESSAEKGDDERDESISADPATDIPKADAHGSIAPRIVVSTATRMTFICTGIAEKSIAL
jgi:hypothetical protein